jgi:HisJ family histidinol phosphate phosphatase
MIANYHTHTRWCHHGTGEIEDFILAALAAGYVELAITEHVPLPGDPDYNRMAYTDFAAYNAELDRMIAKYAGRIRVRKGFECEYYPAMLDYYRKLRDEYGYEILLLGHHTSCDMKHDNFFLQTPRQLALYADEVCAGLETGLFTVLAHPDVPMNGYPRYDAAAEKMMARIFETCAAQNVPAEINANGLLHGRGYPCPQAWSLAAEYPCIIGADAHKPEYLSSPAIALCEQLAAHYGLHPLELLA